MNFASRFLSMLFAWMAPYLTDGTTGAPSSKRLLFVASGFTFLGVIIGLSFPVISEGKDAADVLKFMVLTVATMATTGYVGGKVIERSPAGGSTNAPQ